jgi:hypothetical protein
MTSFILLNDGSSKLLLADGVSSLVLVGHIAEVVVSAETPVIGKIKKKRMFTRQRAEPTYTINTEVITFNIPVFWAKELDVSIVVPIYKESIQSQRIKTYSQTSNIIPLSVSTENKIKVKMDTTLESICNMTLKTDSRIERIKGLSKLRILVKHI